MYPQFCRDSACQNLWKCIEIGSIPSIRTTALYDDKVTFCAVCNRVRTAKELFLPTRLIRQACNPREKSRTMPPNDIWLGRSEPKAAASQCGKTDQPQLNSRLSRIFDGARRLIVVNYCSNSFSLMPLCAAYNSIKMLLADSSCLCVYPCAALLRYPVILLSVGQMTHVESIQCARRV